MRRYGWPYAIIALILVIVAAGAAGAATARTVALTQQQCGDDWSGPSAGRHTFTVRDDSPDQVQVYLIDPRRNTVYAEARDLDPSTSRPIDVALGGGPYALRCVFSNGDIRTSRTFTIAGPATNPGVVPMSDLALEQPVDQYRVYVQAALPGLLRDAQTLNSALQRGDIDAARTAWLPAHLDYERLGAAYNTFEDFDSAINGTAAGLPRGVNDPSWTGFFRIEYGLWHHQPLSTLTPIGRQLVSDIQGLAKDFPSEDTDPVDLPLRSHEILENALELQLTGDDDYGSHTTLQTVLANTQGTQAVLNTLRPLIEAGDPALLTRIDALMATFQADLTGGVTHQRLDGDLGALLEQLAVIPNLLQERTSA